LTCFLSIGIGFGISSSLSFLLLMSVGLSRESILITETLLAMILAVLFRYRWKSETKTFLVNQCIPQSSVPSGTRRAISISFLIVLSSSVILFAASSWRDPHG